MHTKEACADAARVVPPASSVQKNALQEWDAPRTQSQTCASRVPNAILTAMLLLEQAVAVPSVHKTVPLLNHTTTPLATNNGEQACEGQGLDKTQCQAMGCCQWDHPGMFGPGTNRTTRDHPDMFRTNRTTNSTWPALYVTVPPRAGKCKRSRVGNTACVRYTTPPQKTPAPTAHLSMGVEAGEDNEDYKKGDVVKQQHITIPGIEVLTDPCKLAATDRSSTYTRAHTRTHACTPACTHKHIDTHAYTPYRHSAIGIQPHSHIQSHAHTYMRVAPSRHGAVNSFDLLELGPQPTSRNVA